MSISLLLNNIIKPWCNLYCNSMKCDTTLTLPGLGTSSCLCTVNGVVSETTFPSSQPIGPSTDTTFAVESIIYSNGVTLAQDPTHLNYNAGNQTLTATHINSSSIPSLPLSVSNGGTANINYTLGDSVTTTSVNWDQRDLYDNGGNWSVKWQDRNLDDNNNIISVDYGNRTLNDTSAASSIDWTNRVIYDNSGTVPSIDYGNRVLDDSAGTTSIYWEGRTCLDASENPSVDYGNRNLRNASGTNLINWSGSVPVATNLIVSGVTANSKIHTNGSSQLVASPITYYYSVNNSTQSVPSGPANNNLVLGNTAISSGNITPVPSSGEVLISAVGIFQATFTAQLSGTVGCVLGFGIANTTPPSINIITPSLANGLVSLTCIFSNTTPSYYAVCITNGGSQTFTHCSLSINQIS